MGVEPGQRDTLSGVYRLTQRKKVKERIVILRNSLGL